jgi:tetratricopeptide (TPR) repeat protein
MSTEMIKLKCPSCGGQLDLPNNLDIAFCTFCGTKVVINKTEKLLEQQKLERYSQLREIAEKANNYDEVVEYCNKVLEINPNDVDSWIAKAVAVWGLSNSEKDRWQEVLEYLRTAKRLAQDENKIIKIYKDLIHKRVVYYDALVGNYIKLSGNLRNQGLDGRQYMHQAIEYLLRCLICTPDSISGLDTLEKMTKYVEEMEPGIRWGDEINNWFEILTNLRSKQLAEEKTPQLSDELIRERGILESLRFQNKIFSEKKIKETEERIQKLEIEISACERSLNYEPPHTEL